MLAYGGNGPLHACGIANHLGIDAGPGAAVQLGVLGARRRQHEPAAHPRAVALPSCCTTRPRARCSRGLRRVQPDRRPSSRPRAARTCCARALAPKRSCTASSWTCATATSSSRPPSCRSQPPGARNDVLALIDLSPTSTHSASARAARPPRPASASTPSASPPSSTAKRSSSTHPCPDRRARAGDPATGRAHATSSAVRGAGRHAVFDETALAARRSGRRARRSSPPAPPPTWSSPAGACDAHGRDLVPQERLLLPGDSHEHVDRKPRHPESPVRNRRSRAGTDRHVPGRDRPCSWDRPPRSCAATRCSPAPTRRSELLPPDSTRTSSTACASGSCSRLDEAFDMCEQMGAAPGRQVG